MKRHGGNRTRARAGVTYIRQPRGRIALIRSEARWSLETVHEAVRKDIGTFWSDWATIKVNQRLREILGFGPEEDIEDIYDLTDTTHPMSDTGLHTWGPIFGRSVDIPLPFRATFHIRRWRTNEVRRVSLEMTVWQDGYRQIFEGTIEDITDRAEHPIDLAEYRRKKL